MWAIIDDYGKVLLYNNKIKQEYTILWLNYGLPINRIYIRVILKFEICNIIV